MTLRAACLSLALFALPATASACDLHGSWFQPMSNADWAAFTPIVSDEDPALRSEFSPEARPRADVPAAYAKRKKPSFSFAAKRASERALASRDAKADAPADTAKPDAPVKKAALDADR